MQINEVAALSGATVRTLHYYDKIGLLKPSGVTKSGYHIYDDEVLCKLQQILFLKELEFPLLEVKKMIENPAFEQKGALQNQKEILLKKRKRLDRILALMERVMKGEEMMSVKEFDSSEIEGAKAKYAKEVKERWGESKAYAQSEAKVKHYKKENWQEIEVERTVIFEALAAAMPERAQSKTAQALVQRWKQHITDWFYDCNNEMLQGLAQMYRADERFKENMDAQKPGLAFFLADAIDVYCTK